MNLRHKLFESDARRQYRLQGYRLFRGVFTSELIEAIAGMVRELIPTYKGELRRQDGQFAANDFFPGTRLVRNSVLHPHVDLPAELEPLRTKLAGMVTSPAMAACLRQLDGVRHYIVHQSLLFFAAQTTELHLDSWSVDTAPLGRAHTAWIPLQDLDHRSGVPSLIPWPRGKVVTERELRLRGDGSRDHRYDEYHRALRKMMLDRSPEAVNPLLRMGDIVVWSSLTPHFTLPAQSFPTERLSLQVLIRPAADRWGDFLSQPYDRTSVQIERATEHFSVRVLGKGNVRSAD
jgi:hypothetical protein